MLRAVGLSEGALRREPRYAPAHLSLARALSMLSINAPTSPSELLPRVRTHAAAALRLDARLVEAHSTWGSPASATTGTGRRRPAPAS